MIEIELPSGVVLEFPDDTPAAQINQAIAHYLAAAASTELDFAEHAAELQPPAEPVAPIGRRLHIEPYRSDDDAGLDGLISQAPEVAAPGGVCRSALERSRLPGGGSVDPPGDRFADNWWPNWHGRR